MNIGSLCSGIGGLDLAAEWVTGGRTVWQVDHDPDRASYEDAARLRDELRIIKGG